MSSQCCVLASAFVVCALASACDASGDKPMRLFLPGMSHSVPYNGYDPNPLTRSGATAMRPPPGAVSYGGFAPEFGPGKEEAARAGRELTNPHAGDEVLPRGKRVYDTFCLVCHGPAGEGDGPIIGRFPNPPSLLAPRAEALPDGHLVHVIAHGQGLMASYAVQVRPDDRWKVVTYIRSLQRTRVKPAAAADPEDPVGGGSQRSDAGASGGGDEHEE